MTKAIEPSEIGKHPHLIKSKYDFIMLFNVALLSMFYLYMRIVLFVEAQGEMTQVDVLVCGKCHAVYHHVEPFREHKTKPCKVDSTLRDCVSSKHFINLMFMV